MAKLPAVKVTKNGKHYFLVNGRKVFIESNMTKREMMSIYKLLLKKEAEKENYKKCQKFFSCNKAIFQS